MTNCGISRWDDPNEINARLKALTSQPIWEVTDEYYNNVILKYFDEQCKGSKAVYEEYFAAVREEYHRRCGRPARRSWTDCPTESSNSDDLTNKLLKCPLREGVTPDKADYDYGTNLYTVYTGKWTSSNSAVLAIGTGDWSYKPYKATVTPAQTDTQLTLTLKLEYNGRTDLNVSGTHTLTVKAAQAAPVNYTKLLNAALTAQNALRDASTGETVSKDAVAGISLDMPKKAIGRNTIDAMRSGITLGNACMIDGMIERIEEELGQKATVVATGGIARFILPMCRRKIIYDRNLLLKGLVILYENNRRDNR